MTYVNFHFNNQVLMRLRKERGLSRNEFSQATCIDRSQISRLENGITKDPLLETVFVISNFFQVDLEVFKSGSAL